MNEFELIDRYFKRPPRRSDVVLAGGDDAAVLQLGANEQLVVTTDTLIAGTHFPADGAPERVAARALRANLSDLAAMAAQPRWYTLALSLPEADTTWLEGFGQGLAAEEVAWQIDLVGGDTTRGALVITLQMMGAVRAGNWVGRSGARPGDTVLVTGTPGDAAGFLALPGETASTAARYLEQRFWYPQPRVEFARRAAPWIHAACDISDGLVADLTHICRASSVGAQVDTTRLPFSDALVDVFDSSRALELALSGGDDLELCFAAAESDLDDLYRVAAELDLQLTAIGRIRDGESVDCVDADGRLVTVRGGYTHF